MAVKVRGDFNGLFGKLLCLSHSEVATSDTGDTVELREGMEVVAFEEDLDDQGNAVFLVARGCVEPSPEPLRRCGSRWALRINNAGVRHAPTLDDA